MADFVAVSGGVYTDNIAADEVGGLKFQRTKMVWGADGVAVDVEAAAPLPVQLRTSGGVDLPGDAAQGLDVDVTRMAALPAGTNNIGDVDVLTLPALPAGTNNIGDVDVLTLPALPAGTNNIGDVDVLTLPALAAGDAVIGRAKLTDGTLLATLLNLTNAKPLATAIVDGSGNQITSFGGSGGTAAVDDSAFSVGVTSVTPVGALYQATPDTVDDGDIGAPRMTQDRRLIVRIEDILDAAGGTSVMTANPRGIGVTLMNKLEATQDTVAVVGSQSRDDAITDKPSLIGGRGSTATPAAVGTDGDLVDLWLDTVGRAHVIPDTAAAHDAPVSGNPFRIAAKANANEPAVVSADGDTVDLWADLFGRAVVLSGHPNPEAPVSINATASGDTAVLAAPGASLSLHICKGTILNAGASPIVVALQENGSATSRWSGELAAEGGGAAFDFGSRGWKLTANTGLDVNLNGAGDVRVNVTEYYIAP